MNYSLALFTLLSTAQAFTMNSGVRSSLVSKPMLAQNMNALKMSAVDDEVAALRAAAQKARDEARKLAKELGKEEMMEDKKEAAKKEVEKMSPEKVKEMVSPINFESGDFQSQVSTLDQLSESSKLGLWKSAQTSSANTNSPSPLRSYPVSLNFLEQRTGGKITAESLGVGGEDDVTLDDFKYATLYVTAISSIVGVLALIFLPENTGATVCYFAALVPILFLGVGSTAPAAIAGAIAAFKGIDDGADMKEERICRHEAGHFLCGYLCGLPVKAYELNDLGYPCVEFYPSTDGEAMGRELSEEEINALSVVAMSGSVAEALEFGEAKGGQNDLLELNRLYRRSKNFIGSQKQQDLTRWGALAAYNMIVANKDKYDKLVAAFREKKSVADCIAAIESQ